MALLKNLNLTWLLLACMAVLTVALSDEPSDFEYDCYVKFGTNIEPCYVYLEMGGEAPAECCQAVKSNLSVFDKRNMICNCIQGLSQGATEAQTDRFFALPGKCVGDSRLKFNSHTNCSKVK